MGFLNKLKNVFFEEEEVEVDENELAREKVPVAKKIDVVETKKKEEEKEKENERPSNRLDLDNKHEESAEKDFKFPMGFDDKDFEVEKTIEIFGPVKEKTEVLDTVPEVVSDEPPIEPMVEEETTYEEKITYREPVHEEVYEPVYKEEIRERETNHKLYEGREEKPVEEEKTGFTPSPIISPIYGILNKNYKKEEIVTKSEKKKVEVAQVKDELDLVREKAYGDLAGEISASIEDEVIDIEENKPVVEKEKEDLLYDLNEEDSPTVKTVTVGDAEEYFNDLGLEYNVDYKVEKDEEKEEPKTRTRRVEKVDNQNKDEDDKNLFELIDAMYEDEDKE